MTKKDMETKSLPAATTNLHFPCKHIKLPNLVSVLLSHESSDASPSLSLLLTQSESTLHERSSIAVDCEATNKICKDIKKIKAKIFDLYIIVRYICGLCIFLYIYFSSIKKKEIWYSNI